MKGKISGPRYVQREDVWETAPSRLKETGRHLRCVNCPHHYCGSSTSWWSYKHFKTSVSLCQMTGRSFPEESYLHFGKIEFELNGNKHAPNPPIFE
jgi:hypothetical protein